MSKSTNDSDGLLLAKYRRAIIFGAGEYYEEMPFVPPQAYVIAADGGYDHVMSLGIEPHVLVGDMDSIQERDELDLAPHVIALPSEKDDSDMLAAVKHAWALGMREFEFYGVFGGRMDHSIANLQTAAKIAAAGGVAFLHGDHVITTVIQDATMTFPAGYVAAGRPLSVFAHSSVCAHVSITGLKYCVDDVEFSNLEPMGLSNEFLPDTPAEISVDGGALLVIYPSEAPTPRVESRVPPVDSADFGQLTQKKSAYLQPNAGAKRGRHVA
ncbi:thiamine diphosphokinase [Alloscardovia macacae]|nr:thiamine diphosphokinase [Alloscardovia macacae]